MENNYSESIPDQSAVQSPKLNNPSNLNQNQLFCPVCHQPIKPEYYFCPNCGTNLKETLGGISVWTQVGIYFISVFLPPLGFWPGVKYFMKQNPQAKKIGIIAIGLTLLSSIITIWLIYGESINYLNTLRQSLTGF